MTITYDRRILFAFVAVVLIFGLLSWRGEVNSRRGAVNARHIAEAAEKATALALATCRRTAVNTARLNATTNAVIGTLSAVRPQTPALLALERIYRDSLLIVPAC